MATHLQGVFKKWAEEKLSDKTKKAEKAFASNDRISAHLLLAEAKDLAIFCNLSLPEEYHKLHEAIWTTLSKECDGPMEKLWKKLVSVIKK